MQRETGPSASPENTSPHLAPNSSATFLPHRHISNGKLRPLRLANPSLHLELLLSAPSAPNTASIETGQTAASHLLRVKRQRESELDTLVLQRTGSSAASAAKKVSVQDLSTGMTKLRASDNSSSNNTAASISALLSSSLLQEEQSTAQLSRRVFRRVETITARQAAERGLFAVVDSIQRHKAAGGTVSVPRSSVRKQAVANKQAREKLLTEKRDARTNGRRPIPTEEEITLNYMPLVRKFMESEHRSREQQQRSALEADLDEYTVDIYREEAGEAGAGVLIHVEPFDFGPLEYEDDRSSHSDHDSEDSNAEEHAHNSYPDDSEGSADDAFLSSEDEMTDHPKSVMYRKYVFDKSLDDSGSDE